MLDSSGMRPSPELLASIPEKQGNHTHVKKERMNSSVVDGKEIPFILQTPGWKKPMLLTRNDLQDVKNT